MCLMMYLLLGFFNADQLQVTVCHQTFANQILVRSINCHTVVRHDVRTFFKWGINLMEKSELKSLLCPSTFLFVWPNKVTWQHTCAYKRKTIFLHAHNGHESNYCSLSHHLCGKFPECVTGMDCTKTPVCCVIFWLKYLDRI